MTAETDEVAYFFHGMPGSEHDARLIKTVDDRVRLIAPNLLDAGSLDPMHDLLASFDDSTREIADGQINVVGFSIGAMVAIKIAAARPKRVGRLTLISPAAPLSLGDFLPEMAGKPVFDLAIKRPRSLRTLTFVQGLVSAVAPGFLIKQLFAKCGAAEKKLIDDETFQEVIRHGFANSFRRHPVSYAHFVRSYVQDWSPVLSNIRCPVDLWHGDKDTWSPIAMSLGLKEALAGPAHQNSIPGTEHYSTLAEVSLAPIGGKTA